LLLEDVDAAFVDRSAGGGGAARLTFSGLLNAIDGVSSRLLHVLLSMPGFEQQVHTLHSCRKHLAQHAHNQPAAARAVTYLAEHHSIRTGSGMPAEDVLIIPADCCVVSTTQVAAQEGRLLFMTTNHIERLNDALIRPGRVDVRCFLGPATRQQATNLFVSFYRDLPHLLLQPHSEPKAAAAAADDAVPMLNSGASDAELTAAVVGCKQPADPAAVQKADDSKAPAAELLQQQQQQPCLKQPQVGRSASLILSRAEAAAAAREVARREAVLVDLAQQFAVQLPADGGVSMAQLQGFLMVHR
jgi:hypothetical protein